MSDARMTSTPLAKRRFPLALAVGLGLVAVAAAALGYLLLLRPQLASAPRLEVLIKAPREGQRVAVGQPVAMSSLAQSPVGIVRTELWVDGELQEVQTSPMLQGAPSLPMLAAWRPAAPGPHTLTARAFDARGGRAHASVTVEAFQPPDRDADGVLDADDACPDQPGWALTTGCPDRDGDGIVDAEDACPDGPGPPAASGCPQPAGGDRDGDGVPDDADASPDEAGALALGGRPLWAEGQGDASPAPDADGDGVPDERDLCPEAAGPAASGGCPPSGAGDRDGDGLADDVDLAPGEPGLPEHGGCPPPSEDRDSPEAPSSLVGFPGLIRGFFAILPPPPPPPGETSVEFQALELRTHQQYDGVTCYACLGGGAAEQITLDRVDGMLWQLPAEFGPAGARTVLVAPGRPLTLTLQCGAYRSGAVDESSGTPEGSFGDAGGDQSYYDLGSFTASHTQEEWDGRRLYTQSVSPDPAAPGRVFHLIYRACEGSCAESALPAPNAHLWHYLDGMYLGWSWTGDPEQIDRFMVRSDIGGVAVATRTVDKNEYRVFIGDLAPGCGQVRRFWVTAERTGDGVSSPASDMVLWHGDLCPGYLYVTFQRVASRSYCESDPIYGQFWANEEVLEFDAADNWWGNEHYRAGLGFPHRDASGGCGLDIQSFFDDVRGLDAPWAGSTYAAPVSSRVILPMRYNRDLTIGLRIYEDTPEGENRILAEGHGTIPASHLMGEDFNRSYGPDNPYAEHAPNAGTIWVWQPEGQPTYYMAHSDGLLLFTLEWAPRPQAP